MELIITPMIIQEACRIIRPAIKSPLSADPDILTDICAAWKVHQHIGWGGLKTIAGKLYAQKKDTYDRTTRKRLIWLCHMFKVMHDPTSLWG